jgi:hypothetical protein
MTTGAGSGDFVEAGVAAELFPMPAIVFISR